MNRIEHLLVILSEECAEAQKEVSKALRFGLDDCAPNQSLTNRNKIAIELNDLMAVVEMLIDEGVITSTTAFTDKEITIKKEKVERYLKYSKTAGTLK